MRSFRLRMSQYQQYYAGLSIWMYGEGPQEKDAGERNKGGAKKEGKQTCLGLD